MCVTSWCDLDLTFDFAIVTLTFKILFRLFFRNRKLYLVRILVGVGAMEVCNIMG